MPRGYAKDGKRRSPSPLNRCAICKHPDRPLIEALRCDDVSLDKIAERFGVDRLAIWRHMKNHVSDQQKASYFVGPARMMELAEFAAKESESVIDYYRILRASLLYRLDLLAQGDDHSSFANIAKRLTEVLDKIAQVTGQVAAFSTTTINVQNNVQILNSPPFADLEAGLLQLCARYPDIRSDVISLFRDLDQRYGAPAMKTVTHAEGAANA